LLPFFTLYRKALIWALFIAVLCGLPGKDIPHISFLELLSFDKWVHAGVFFVLVLLLSRAYLNSGSITLRHFSNRISCALAICYGALLEVLQGLIFIDRSADVYDFIANSTGALIAVVWIKYYRRNIPGSAA